MAPTFRQLRYFTVLAEELHFGRSARRLNISQPPLSASIQQLEQAVGAQLLDRTSRHVVLTPAGRIFAERARRLLDDLAESAGLARRIALSPGGVVRVGFVPSMIFRGMPQMLTSFQRHHPEYSIQLIDMNSGSQVEALVEGRIEIGFVHCLDLETNLQSILIATEPFVCCLPADHFLARRASLSLAELGQLPQIMFTRERAPSYHDHIMGLFKTANVVPLVAHEVSNWLTIVAMVGHGLGAALVPRALAKIGIGRAVFCSLSETWTGCDVHCAWSASADHQGRDHLIARVKDGLSETA